MHLLPPNVTAPERALSSTGARLLDVPTDPVRRLWNPWECPSEALPWLAWSLSVSPWDSNWSEQRKREAIAVAVEIHRIRGTVGAVIRALETLGYEVRLDERTGAPYCFRVLLDVDGKAYEEADYDAAERAVLTAKNARSHLTGVVASIARTGVLYTGAAVADGQTTVIKYAEKPKPLHLEFTTSAVRVSPLWMQMDYHATPADDDV